MTTMPTPLPVSHPRRASGARAGYGARSAPPQKTHAWRPRSPSAQTRPGGAGDAKAPVVLARAKTEKARRAGKWSRSEPDQALLRLRTLSQARSSSIHVGLGFRDPGHRLRRQSPGRAGPPASSDWSLTVWLEDTYPHPTPLACRRAATAGWLLGQSDAFCSERALAAVLNSSLLPPDP